MMFIIFIALCLFHLFEKITNIYKTYLASYYYLKSPKILTFKLDALNKSIIRLQIYKIHENNILISLHSGPVIRPRCNESNPLSGHFLPDSGALEKA